MQNLIVFEIAFLLTDALREFDQALFSSNVRTLSTFSSVALSAIKGGSVDFSNNPLVNLVIFHCKF